MNMPHIFPTSSAERPKRVRPYADDCLLGWLAEGAASLRPYNKIQSINGFAISFLVVGPQSCCALPANLPGIFPRLTRNFIKVNVL